ncbi:hypothetical protein PORY_001855 [Pneumocystis oryctolagi]|uniref:Uncharacterized protein n=1 Tax=Pneumocystis oryctolagi TaxID=42067 RepID=A0ACB7CAP2_9ASCO|nr:hypothetical protein PORY_001855 [Pneumocystis oryctolagi]
MSLEKSLDEIINDKKTLQNSRVSNKISRRQFFKNERPVSYYKARFLSLFNLIFRQFLTFDLQKNEYFFINSARRNYHEPWTHDLYEGSVNKSSGRVSKQTYRPVSKVLNAKYQRAISYRVKIENLHYELTEDDLNGLFKRIGPVTKLKIKYDRSGRSTGIAYVNFEKIEDARNAISQFNGANAAGQPITLTLDLQPPHKQQRKTNSLFNRISNFKVKSLYERKSLNKYRPHKREENKYKTQEDLDNELDKYMNIAIQSKNTEKPMAID